MRVVSLPDSVTSCSTVEQTLGIRGKLPAEAPSHMKSLSLPQLDHLLSRQYYLCFTTDIRVRSDGNARGRCGGSGTGTGFATFEGTAILKQRR
jgi:hypothetical protein